MKSHVFHDLLARSPLFHGLAEEDLADLQGLFEHDFAVSGEYLVHAGDPSDCLYLVLSGRLQVVLPGEDGASEKVVSDVTRGETVGEMGMITGEPRSATILAARDSELARLSKAHFDEVVQRHPGILMPISRSLVQRLRDRDRKPPAEGPRALAILPAGPDVPLKDFMDAFLPLLAEQGATLHLNRQIFDEALGQGASDDDVDVWDQTDARIADWLSDREADHRFMVFEAEAEESAWTRRCFRQADRVLLVARAGADPALNLAEQDLFAELGARYRTDVDLVILHESGSRPPTGTAAWLAERPAVVRHHHVHLGTPGHMERVVRFLTNRAVGLVLGGGGAKGSAHVGVIRAMQEAGIPIDMIGGTSSGAGVGAQIASGMSTQEARDMLQERFMVHNPFKRPTLPVYSLVGRQPVDRTCQVMHGDLQVEDLWIPFFCVSCNISTGATVVHRSGPLWKAVRASAALPGVLAPVVEGRLVLVDGGVVDNVPVTEMKALNPGPAIVVNVSPDVDLVLPESVESYPSPWAFLRALLTPFRRTPDVPSLVSILARSALINSVARKKQTMGMADLFLEPPLEGFSLMNPENIDALIDIGYRYGQEAIGAWLEDPAVRTWEGRAHEGL